MTKQTIETWLNVNRRVLWAGMALAALAALSGAALACLGTRNVARTSFGLALLAVGIVSSLVLLRQMRRPRIGHRQGRLLVYLGGAKPIEIPIEIVECFFLAQADVGVPGLEKPGTRMAAVTVRLSESASDWAERDVKPVFGRWADGYITIRGTWCEPLSVERVNELNARLRDAQAKRRRAIE
jgi:hypothetical protein